MHPIDTLDTTGLGNRSYLVAGTDAAAVIDPPRDIDRVLAAAERHGVRIALVAETHVHNDYVTGGLELARLTGARYLVPAGADVRYARVPVTDGDAVPVDDGLKLEAVATPGHTQHHTSYVLHDDGLPAAAFTGGSLLTGTVGRTDLVDPRLAEPLARAQFASAHRLADRLPDDALVLPTHGFGSFCASGGSEDTDRTTMGEQRRANEALSEDVDTFVGQLLAGPDDVPAYYARMGPVNADGPPPLDLTPPETVDAGGIAARLEAGEWVVDLRSRVAFAREHVRGTYNFEGDGRLATYLAWLIPWGTPVTLLAGTAGDIAAAQRELVRVGIDRPAASATGGPADWLAGNDRPSGFRRADFAALARELRAGEDSVVLDVRRDAERAEGAVTGSVHLPVHQLPGRLADVPAGTVWTHCASGMRAAMAASLLDAAGRSVVLVDDHFEAAEEAGLVTTGRTG
ncbi:MBL fold metallo-hydrolase [Streptomyces sp. NPDC047108]|uniref:MBL fold metallo-hydrolase n=1 Tax=Streptomyces sp. NPDC047108 TaxID=3155025 RepID=UPI003404C2B7